jgi:hypothetical protein
MNQQLTPEERVGRHLAYRRRIGEQAFQVEHYLALWKSAPTAANWRRVVEAAEAYYPLLDDEGPEALARRLRAGQRIYWTFARCGGVSGSVRTGLGRFTRAGARGRLYEQRFRKGSRSWTKES